MPKALHAWYSLRDLEALGMRQAELHGELQLRQLPRFTQLLHSADGSVKATLRFRQPATGWVSLSLQYEAAVELTCQRCLEPMTAHLTATTELALLESSALENRVPEGTEPVLLEDDRTKLAELVEDELIVGLPLVPKHERPEDCGSLARLISEPAAPRDAAKP